MRSVAPVVLIALLCAAVPAAAQRTWSIQRAATCDALGSEAIAWWLDASLQESRLRDALLASVAAAGAAELRGLVVARYDSAASMHIVSYLLPEMDSASAARVVDAFPALLAASGTRRHLLVRLEESTPVDWGRHDLTVCCPSLWNPSMVGSTLWRAVRTHPESRRIRRAMRGRSIGTELVIDRNGSVVHVDILDSVGDEEIDKLITGALKAARFDPLTVEGVARDSRVTVPIRLR